MYDHTAKMDMMNMVACMTASNGQTGHSTTFLTHAVCSAKDSANSFLN